MISVFLKGMLSHRWKCNGTDVNASFMILSPECVPEHITVSLYSISRHRLLIHQMRIMSAAAWVVERQQDNQWKASRRLPGTYLVFMVVQFPSTSLLPFLLKGEKYPWDLL